MDRTRVCGTRNPGSIPGEGTNQKDQKTPFLRMVFFGLSK